MKTKLQSSHLGSRVEEMLRELSDDSAGSGKDDDGTEEAAADWFAAILECWEAREVKGVVQQMVAESFRRDVETRLVRDVLKLAFTCFVGRRRNGALGVVRMIQVYDAVADVLSRDSRAEPDAIDHVLWLAADRNMNALLRLKGSKDISRHEMIVEKLASTRIFRTMIEARWVEGPRAIFFFEAILYVFLGLSYSMLVLARREGSEPAYSAAGNALRTIFGLPSLHYFSVKLDITLRFHAKFELGMRAKENHEARRCAPLGRVLSPAASALSLCWGCVTWVWHRTAGLVGLVLYGLPLYVVLLCGPASWRDLSRRSCQVFVENFGPWFLTPPQMSHYSLIPPWAWAKDPLNAIELAYLFTCWVAMLGVSFPGLVQEGPLWGQTTYDHILNLGILLMWLRSLNYLRAHVEFAAFVTLFTSKIFSDMKSFLVVFFIIFFAFCHTIYMTVGYEDPEYFGQDEQSNDGHMFSNLFSTSWILYLFALTGEVDDTSESSVVDKLLLGTALFVFVVVLLNLLIAIVAEAHQDAMARSSDLFWRSRFDIVSETIALWGNASKFHTIDRDSIGAILQNQLKEALEYTLTGGASHRQQLQRILQAIQAEKSPIIAMQDKLDALQAQLAQLLAYHHHHQRDSPGHYHHHHHDHHQESGGYGVDHAGGEEEGGGGGEDPPPPYE